MDFELADVLSSIGVSTDHLEAFDDERFDEEIRSRMDNGLSLAGDDIGTPIIGFETKDGEMVGIFGPVITRVPDSCLLYTSPSPRDQRGSRMPSSA